MDAEVQRPLGSHDRPSAHVIISADRPSVLAPITSLFTVLSDESYVVPDLTNALAARMLPPLLQLEGAPIRCNLRLETEALRRVGDAAKLSTENKNHGFHIFSRT